MMNLDDDTQQILSENQKMRWAILVWPLLLLLLPLSWMMPMRPVVHVVLYLEVVWGCYYRYAATQLLQRRAPQFAACRMCLRAAAAAVMAVFE